MFAIFYELFKCFVYGKDFVENTKAKSEKKQKAIMNNEIYYYDKHGKMYMTSNDLPVFLQVNKSGHRCLFSVQGGFQVHDFDEHLNYSIPSYIKDRNNITVEYYRTLSGREVIFGEKYLFKDKETGDVYIYGDRWIDGHAYKCYSIFKPYKYNDVPVRKADEELYY